MTAEKISVIVPVYNSEEYLSECIESILKQDYQNYEIILIDDGSTDSSGAICDEYSAKYKQIRTLHQQNKGVSAARNAGLKVANGRYITFVDSDDWVEENYLSVLQKYMQPGGMAVCDFEKDGIIITFNETISILSNIEACESTTNRKGMDGRPWGRLFDKEQIDLNSLSFSEDIAIGEDALFCVQYLSYVVKNIVWIHKPLYHYRTNSNSTLCSIYKEKSKYHPKVLSACIALDREIECMHSYPELVHIFRMRQITEKRNALRIIVINKWELHEIYKIYLRDIRKGLWSFLCCDIGQPVSEKIGVVFSCISPKLEYFVWRIWKSVKR